MDETIKEQDWFDEDISSPIKGIANDKQKLELHRQEVLTRIKLYQRANLFMLMMIGTVIFFYAIFLVLMMIWFLGGVFS